MRDPRPGIRGFTFEYAVLWFITIRKFATDHEAVFPVSKRRGRFDDLIPAKRAWSEEPLSQQVEYESVASALEPDDVYVGHARAKADAQISVRR